MLLTHCTHGTAPPRRTIWVQTSRVPRLGTLLQTLASQSVTCGPAASSVSSPRSLLEIQTLRPPYTRTIRTYIFPGSPVTRGMGTARVKSKSTEAVALPELIPLTPGALSLPPGKGRLLRFKEGRSGLGAVQGTVCQAQPCTDRLTPHKDGQEMQTVAAGTVCTSFIRISSPTSHGTG